MPGVVITLDAKGKGHNIITPTIREEAPPMPAAEVRTVRSPGGTWTIHITPVPAFDPAGNKDWRFNVTARFVAEGSTKPSRVEKKERLTKEAADAFNPAGDWSAALKADHRHARAIREVRGES